MADFAALSQADGKPRPGTVLSDTHVAGYKASMYRALCGQELGSAVGDKGKHFLVASLGCPVSHGPAVALTLCGAGLHQ